MDNALFAELKASLQEALEHARGQRHDLRVTVIPDREVSMPAKSEKQRKLMAMCQHDPKHAKGKCPSKAVAREFSHKARKGGK